MSEQSSSSSSSPSPDRKPTASSLRPKFGRARIWDKDPPLPVDRQIPKQVDRELRAFINPAADALIETIQRASRYAKVSTGPAGSRISLSRRALTLGAIETGLRDPSAYHSSSWLAQWALHIDPKLEERLAKEDRSDAVREALRAGALFVPTRSLGPILQQARRYAQATVQRDEAGLRHILVAVCERPGRAFVYLQPAPTALDRANLRDQLIKNTIASPERRENVRAWQRILAQGLPPLSEMDEEDEDEDQQANVAQHHLAGGAEDDLRPLEPAQGPDDHYRMQTDDPAINDLLDRSAFARVLSERIRQVQDERRKSNDARAPAFMLHIHGRWGSGKSSVLNFLKTHLESAKGTGRSARVVTFNAWEHNSRKPPWWPFLSTIYRSVVGDQSLERRTRWRLRSRWWAWRLRADILPIIFMVALFGGIAFAFGRGDKSAETMLKIVAAIATGAAAIYAYSRTLMFGSQRAAQTYSDLKADPLAPVIGLFEELVDAIEDDLVVLIDDLDRCDADFIVDLLEGIQNLFKRRPVTYVAAADRRWICTAFEKRYSDFAPLIAEPGRPLGFLFLEKMFQISAGMPKLTSELQGRYLDALTDIDARPAVPVSDAIRKEAEEAFSGLESEAAIRAKVESVEGESAEKKRAFREQAAIQITTPAARRATENRLRPLLHIMEPNPRAMKRLVNEIAIAQARGAIEGRFISPEARARWAMLSLTWPLFTDYIVDQPEAIDHWRPAKPGAGPKTSIKTADLPIAIQALASSKRIPATIGATGEPGCLEASVLKDLLR